MTSRSGIRCSAAVGGVTESVSGKVFPTPMCGGSGPVRAAMRNAGGHGRARHRWGSSALLTMDLREGHRSSQLATVWVGGHGGSLTLRARALFSRRRPSCGPASLASALETVPRPRDRHLDQAHCGEEAAQVRTIPHVLRDARRCQRGAPIRSQTTSSSTVSRASFMALARLPCAVASIVCISEACPMTNERSAR